MKSEIQLSAYDLIMVKCDFKKLKNYGTTYEIHMERTVTRTIQQNKIVERINKSLNKHAKSVRLYAGISKAFWIDAINIASYLIN